MINFITLFDKNYLTRGISLYNSLVKNCSTDFTLYILVMDKETENYFLEADFQKIKIVTVAELKIMYPVLINLEKERTRGEFSWTLSSFSIQYAIRKFNLDSCIYLDSDIYFFNDPLLLFKQIGTKSVLITEHNYTPMYDQTATSGKFCVQFMYFKNDEGGNKVLEWWRSSCEKWCYNRVEDGKFGDQKYLDDWESRFNNYVFDCKELGCGIAPWNVQKFNILIENNLVYVEDKISKVKDKVIFYHFHALKQLSKTCWNLSSYELSDDVKIHIYKSYIESLNYNNSQLPLNLQISFNKEKDSNQKKQKCSEFRNFVRYIKRYKQFKKEQLEDKLKSVSNIFEL